MNYRFIKAAIEDRIAFLTLNRPEKHNALCIDMVHEINHFLGTLQGNDVLNALFVLGNKKAFSAGGDLKEMQFLSKEEAEKRSQYVQTTFKLFNTLDFPVVAWVQGVCYGGGLELLLHCDYSFCCETTKLALPEVKYGMIPGAGGVTLLQHRMSKADAFYYLSTGDEIPLDKAFNCGLIQQIISMDTFEEAIERKTKFYNEANGFALKALKKITKVNNNAELEAVYRMESDYFSTLLFENGRKGIDKNFKK